VKVALVVERFDPAGGGVEHAVWRTAHALAAAGDRVTVVAREARPSDACRVVRLPAPRTWQPLRVVHFARRAAKWLRAARARGEVEVVHAFCRALEADVFHAGGGSHWHYLVATHGRRAAALRRASPRHAVQLALEARLLAAPRLLVQCVSRRGQCEFASRYGVPASRAPVVAYGVDAERFAPDAERRARTRAQLSIADGRNVWLFAGSGWQRKGLATAIAAIAATRDREALLLVAGRDAPGAWQALAARLGIAERVRFLGACRDMPRLYDAADGLLLPTRYDAFAMVCLEAAACARPVVTSRAAGAAELLGNAGHVVEDARDVRAFASALDALADPEARRRAGAHGRALALRHDWTTQSARLRDIHRRALEVRSA